MRSRFKWLILLLVPALFIAGVQGYFWLQVKRSVDSLIDTISPIARVEYSNLSAWAFHDISLLDVTARLPNGQPLLSIEKVSISSSSWLDLLSIDSNFPSNSSTHPLNVQFDRFILPSEPLMAFESAAENAAPSFVALVCGDVQNFDLSLLPALGYDSLRGNASLLLDPSPKNNALRLLLRTSIDDLVDGELDLLVGQKRGISLRREQLAHSVIQQLNVAIQDKGLHQRWKTMCSEQSGVAEADYESVYNESLKAWWRAYGVEVSEGVRTAMSELVVAKTSTVIHFEPAIPPSLVKLTAIDGVEDVFSRTEIRLSINDHFVEFSDQEWSVLQGMYAGEVRLAAIAVVDSPIEDETVNESKDTSPLREIVPGVMPMRLPEKEKAFQVTLFPELGNYVGSSIKVKTLIGREMDGILVSVSSSGISMRRHIQQGKATIPVLKDNISAIEVYR